MGFRYELRHPTKSPFTKRDALRAMRTFAKRVNYRPFRAIEFNAWPTRPFWSPVVLKHFGSWNAALAAIGIRPKRPRFHTAAVLIVEMERVWRILGHPPRDRDIRALATIDRKCFYSRWGTIRRCCELIASHRRGEITRAQLLTSGPRGGIRKTYSDSRRWAVAKRDRFRCVICGHSPATNTTLQLHIDHIIPVAQGGDNNIANLRTLCRECNVQRRIPFLSPREGPRVGSSLPQPRTRTRRQAAGASKPRSHPRAKRKTLRPRRIIKHAPRNSKPSRR